MRNTIRARRSLAVSLLSCLLLHLALACAPGSSGDAGVPADAAQASDDAGAADDGGSDDGGVEPCADADPVLGTLTLGEGYSVVDSAALSPSIAVVEVVPGEGGGTLYGLDVAAGAVVNLGPWPIADDAAGSALFEVVPNDVEESYLSWFLAYDGARFAAGYTGAFDTETFVVAGAIALYDTTAGVSEPLRYVDANGNFAAEFVDATLVVNATSLGALEGDTALYAKADAPLLLASYADPTTTFGGPVIATKAGGLVVGGYHGGAQHFSLLSAGDVAAALSGDPIALADAEEIVAAPSLAAARFGDELVYVHGDFFVPFEAVRGVSLDDGAARVPHDVLTFHDECTAVDLLTDMGDDLLVGLSDDAGRRLVRLRAGE